MEFKNVTAQAKGNVYFDGNVVSHAITLEDGSKKTFGFIFAGEYYFGTEAAERMEITDGECVVKIKGEDAEKTVKAGEYFDVPANSGFDIKVATGTAQYICSYIV